MEIEDLDFGLPNAFVKHDSTYAKKPAKKRGTIDSPFTVLVDSNEAQEGHHGYKFQGIVADADENYAPINVLTEIENLHVGDYSIKEYPFISIERKTLPDLFQSVTRTRDIMEERIILMSDSYEYSCVVIEADAQDIYKNPPPHTKVVPKTVYRTVLAWSLRYPNVHWHFCGNREFAEQTTYRLLSMFYEEREKPRRTHSVVDKFIEAYRLGLLSRLAVNEAANQYKPKDPRSKYFVKGWNFSSTNFHGGDFGKLHSSDNADPTSRLLTKDDFKKRIDSSQIPFEAKGKKRGRPTKG